MSDVIPEAATPEAPSLESLARALFDAFASQFPGAARWDEVSDTHHGWLAVAQTASDGASVAAKAVTDALAAERDKARRERNEALDRLLALPQGMKDAMRQIAVLAAENERLRELAMPDVTPERDRLNAALAENHDLRIRVDGAIIERDKARVATGELAAENAGLREQLRQGPQPAFPPAAAMVQHWAGDPQAAMAPQARALSPQSVLPPGMDALAAECERLRRLEDERDELAGLIAGILQSMPDTADEQEWRDRAGALGVTDPDGQPYRAYTEDDL